MCGHFIIGHEGSSLIIKCQYNQYYANESKSFCRISYNGNSQCNSQIKTNVSNRWHSQGRFSLYDNTTEGILYVIMANLTKDDSDKYQCTVDKSNESTAVILEVKEGESVISLNYFQTCSLMKYRLYKFTVFVLEKCPCNV